MLILGCCSPIFYLENMSRETKQDPESREREPNVAEILETVVRLGVESKQEKREKGESWLEKRLESLPSPARDRIRHRDEKLKGLNLDQSQRTEILEDDINSVEMTYVDQRFTFEGGEKILREQFGKEVVREWIDRVLEDPELGIDDLSRVARLSFDANGLKSVNDLSASHEKGDEYLKRIAEIIRNKDSGSHHLLQESGAVEIMPLTGGGDEYSVLVRGDQPLDVEKLQQAVEAIETETAAIDCGDLVDFNDIEVRLRFLGVSFEEYSKMDDGERAQLDEQFSADVPTGFRMKASLSGGVETLQQGLLHAIDDPRDTKRLKADEVDYQRALAKIMGGLWDASDKTAMAAKERYKASLETVEASAEDRTLSQIFSRNKAEREAKKRALEQETKAHQAESLMAEMTRLTAMRQELGNAAYAEAVTVLMSNYNNPKNK